MDKDRKLYDREDRKVTIEEGQRLAKKYNMEFLEISPKTNFNVNAFILDYIVVASENSSFLWIICGESCF